MPEQFEKLPTDEEEREENLEEMKYIEGEVPFEYSYEFPKGEKLEAFQDEDGIGHIIIKREDKIIFDAANLLPKDFKFVTPTYFKKFPQEKFPNKEDIFDYGGYTLRNGGSVDHRRKRILLGEFKSPQDFLAPLHEIGHAVNDRPDELRALEGIDKEIRRNLGDQISGQEKDRAYEILLHEDEAKILSKRERSAWAWAISQLRKIQKDTGINLQSLFPSFEDFQKYVTDSLATYRRSYEWIIKKGYDPDFYKELQKYFDRWKYKHS